MEIAGLKRLVADLLFERGAVLDKSQSLDGRPTRVGERSDDKGFRLKLHEKNPNAPLSPFYINLRTPQNPKPGPLTDDDIFLIGQLMFRNAVERHLFYDFIAGVPYAGNPIAKAFQKAAEVSRRCLVPVLQLIKEESADTRSIVSLHPFIKPVPDMQVILVDDICTRAGTKLEAVKVLESAGLIVKDILVLVDRQQGGAMELLRAGYRLHDIFTVRDLFAYYNRRRVVSREVCDEINDYLDSGSG